MKLMPSKKYILYSKQSPESICIRLSQETTEKHPSSFGWEHSEMFWGQVSARNFVIHPISQLGRNSFLPQVHGDILPTSDGSMIHIKMEPLPFTHGFLKFWMIGVSFFLMMGLLICLGGNLSSGFLLTLISSGMLLFGFSLSRIGFSLSCNSTLNQLKKLTE